MTLFNMTRTSRNKEGRDDDMLKKKKILISKEEFKNLHQDRIDCSQALVVMEDELNKTKKRLVLRNQELKKLRIERAEQLRRIEQLEKQNEDLLKPIEIGEEDGYIYIGGSKNYSSEGIILAKTRWYGRTLTEDEIQFISREKYE